MHEPSIRTPAMIRYPKLFRAGTKVDEMILNLDFAPTLLELAGVSIPSAMQGKSLVNLAQGNGSQWRQDWLYEYFEYPGAPQVRPNRGVRTDRYKFIHYFVAPEEFELYDLRTDPGEKVNLIGNPQYVELRLHLTHRLEQLRKDTGDGMRNVVT
jgi:arylsulfatase A-like enzyme